MPLPLPLLLLLPVAPKLFFSGDDPCLREADDDFRDFESDSSHSAYRTTRVRLEHEGRGSSTSFLFLDEEEEEEEAVAEEWTPEDEGRGLGS